jgi:hypothetical protein
MCCLKDGRLMQERRLWNGDTEYTCPQCKKVEVWSCGGAVPTANTKTLTPKKEFPHVILCR